VRGFQTYPEGPQPPHPVCLTSPSARKGKQPSPRRGEGDEGKVRSNPVSRLVGSSKNVVVAQVGAAHGVKGEVRLKSFTAVPMDVAAYGALEAADGRLFEIETARPAAAPAGDMLVVHFRGIEDRAAAEALNGVELSVPRARLPEAGDDEFYHADLIGLTAETVSGETLGTVIAVQNYGAGDLLEIAAPGAMPVLIPFTRAAVPTVDVAGGRVVVDPPAGLLEESGEET
jgi:16S rRNA processing protein RimM